MHTTRTPEVLLRDLAEHAAGDSDLLDARRLLDEQIATEATGEKKPPRLGAPSTNRGRRRRAVRTVGIAAVAMALGLGGTAVATGVTPYGLSVSWNLLTEGGLEPLPEPVATESREEAFTELQQRAQEADESAQGTYQVQESEAMNIHVGEGEATAEMVSLTSTTWTAADGSYRLAQTRGDEPVQCWDFPPGTARHGHFPAFNTPQSVIDGLLPDGELPEDAAAYALINGYIEAQGTPDPSTRAVILEALDQAGAEYLGLTTDRRGEPAEVLSGSRTQDGITIETRLLVHPENGSVTGWERIVHGLALFGSPHAADSSTAVTETDWVDELPAHADCVQAQVG